MEHSEASRNLCELCGKEKKPPGGYRVPSQDGTKILRVCTDCSRAAWKARASAIQKAKNTTAATSPRRDLTGQNIGCWFVVAYAGQRDGVHYWRCMSRATWADFPAEKMIPEGEILDRKLNAVSAGFFLREEPRRNPIGWIFGEWTVLELAKAFVGPCRKQEQVWKCRCICGTEREVLWGDLIMARRPCCGCRPDEEVRNELRWRQRQAKKGWYKAIGAAHRRIQERQHDKNWTPKMESTLRRFQPMCVICGFTDDLTTHHVKPLCFGHGLEPGNAVRLCRRCNSSIGMSNPNQLPPDMTRKLETAAAQFKKHWENGCESLVALAVTPVKEKPKTLDPALFTLLRAVECGDDNAIAALADWLEERGDSRSAAIRDVQSVRGWQVLAVWQRFGLSLNEINAIRLYYGITPEGVRTPIEQIALLERRQVQTIQNRIDAALYCLTLQVRR